MLTKHEHMKDYASMHKALLKEIAKFENINTSKTMERLGLNYDINYGLSVQQINSIAEIIDKDDEYALHLWKQNEREVKLIALRIFETTNFDANNINEFEKGITNSELAEQSAMYFFSKQDNVLELSEILIESKDFTQMTAFLSISRFAMLNKNAEINVFDNLLNKLFQNQPLNREIYFKRAYAQALLKIGLINTSLASKVKLFIVEITKKDAKFAEYLEQELIPYFD